MGALPEATTKEIRAAVMGETHAAMQRSNINADILVKQLKQELGARVSRTLRVKGKAEHDSTGKPVMAAGIRVLVQTDGDTVIQWNEVAWDVRQKARIDAQKLLGLYPADKHDHKHEGTVFVNTGIHRPMDEDKNGTETPISSSGSSESRP